MTAVRGVDLRGRRERPPRARESGGSRQRRYIDPSGRGHRARGSSPGVCRLCDVNSRWNRRGRVGVDDVTGATQADCHLVVVGRREPNFDPSVSAAVVPGLEFVEIIELGRVSDLGDPSEGYLATSELEGILAAVEEVNASPILAVSSRKKRTWSRLH